MKQRLILLFAFLGLFCTIMAQSDPFIKMYDKNRKQYEKNLPKYRKSAEKGDPKAQYKLGICYFNGYGVTKDLDEAINWFRKAAEQGDAESQNMLGYCYRNGQGVEMDYDQAIYWYDKAASQGSLMSKLSIDALKKERESDQSHQQVNEVQPQQPKTKYGYSVEALPQSDVDLNIPKTNTSDKNTFAVIIGNEKYDDEADVPFAVNDAKVFSLYCQNTLGIIEKHIRYIPNAGYNDLRKAISWLRQGLEAYEGEGRIIFYYAGHGIPNEADKTAYLLPVDGVGSDLESAYSLSTLYKALSEMPAKSITVFLDACFSGTKREGGMMASARGVAIKVKQQAPKNKMVVFTAAQDDETAYPFKSKQHGLFTYYLLKKIQDSKGEVTLGELGDYIKREVKRESFDENNKMQTPTVTPSTQLAQSWRMLKL